MSNPEQDQKRIEYVRGHQMGGPAIDAANEVISDFMKKLNGEKPTDEAYIALSDHIAFMLVATVDLGARLVADVAGAGLMGMAASRQYGFIEATQQHLNPDVRVN